MTIEYREFITRKMLRDEPDVLFVFGDNMIERGLGGQAREMRGEPNAVGIPTKWYPDLGEQAFFKDKDEEHFIVRFEPIAKRLEDHAKGGGKIVWPKDGVGTGLAQLQARAPAIWHLIEAKRKELENL